MRAKLNQAVKAFAVNQSLKIGPNQNVRGWFARLWVALDADRVVNSGGGDIIHLGVKGQNLFGAVTCHVKINGNKRRVINGDSHLFDRCDEEIILAILAQNR